MTIEVKATSRQAQGTGASRRLRNTGRTPGIVYGSGDAQMIELDHNELYYALRNEAFHASVLSLSVDGAAAQSVVLRDFQMHPYKQLVLHIDFQRVDAAKKMHAKVPLHFLNGDLAPGVKLGGGLVSHALNEVDVVCLPANLPEFIEVDLGGLEVGKSIHVADLKLPKGVEVASHHHAGDAVASVQAPRGGAAAAEAAAE